MKLYNMSLRKQSLEVRNKVKEKLNEITGFSFFEYYNDLYGRKGSYEVRRIKGIIVNLTTNYDENPDKDWHHKNDSLEWKEEIEAMDFGKDFKVEFSPVDKLKSMGLDWMRESRRRWVEGHKDGSFYYHDDSPSGPPRGTAEEYDYRFNNLDYYFIIRVIYKDEIGRYTPSGVIKDGSRDKNGKYFTGS